MDTILLVEDDKMFRHMLRGALEAEKFQVIEAANSHRALDILHNHPVDVISVDLGLPDADGLSIIMDIRQFTTVPVIVVSGQENLSQKVQALEAGANDYVAKPFDMVELIARYKTQLRCYKEAQTISKYTYHERSGKGQAVGNSHGIRGENYETIRFGKWVFDPSKFQVFNNETGASSDLTADEFQILESLIMNADRVLKRDELCEVLRHGNYTPTTRALDIKIARIRKKLEDDPKYSGFIKTVRGIGYMFSNKKA